MSPWLSAIEANQRCGIESTWAAWRSSYEDEVRPDESLHVGAGRAIGNRHAAMDDDLVEEEVAEARRRSSQAEGQKGRVAAHAEVDEDDRRRREEEAEEVVGLEDRGLAPPMVGAKGRRGQASRPILAR